MMSIKRLVATPLLIGYVMLVPFCFFGGMLAASAHTMDMAGGMTGSAHTMPMSTDCGMQLPCAGDSDPVEHHMSMFNSITQTQLTDLSLLLAVLVVSLLITFSLNYHLLALLLVRDSYHPRARADQPKSTIKQNILTWLSLFETSPNFA
jgi:hypothetical protein